MWGVSSRLRVATCERGQTEGTIRLEVQWAWSCSPQSGDEVVTGVTLVGGDDHAVGGTVHRAIVDGEFGRIVAGEVDDKSRRYACGIQQER